MHADRGFSAKVLRFLFPFAAPEAQRVGWYPLPPPCTMPVMSDAMERLAREAREAWPDIEVGNEDFTRYVGERLGDDALAEAHGADLCLAFGCLRKNTKALEAFDRTCLSRVPDFIHRIDKSEAFASEVTQILRERLLVGTGGSTPKIADYAGRGPLGSWLRVVAVRVALELQRGKKPQVDDDGSEELATTDDPELDYLRVRYTHEFREAFTEALSQLDAKQQTILQLYLLDGLNIERIGQIYQVHRATVARWISGTRDQLYDDTRQRLRDKLNLDAGEFESIVRLVRSQLDVSVRRILREGMKKEEDP